MTAKLLLQLPKTELQRITDALRERMVSRVVGAEQRALLEENLQK